MTKHDSQKTDQQEIMVVDDTVVDLQLLTDILSDQGYHVSRNLALLRESTWFSLPMLFKNGRGDLLSFEKGIPGDQVFEAVLAAWEKPNTGQ